MKLNNYILNRLLAVALLFLILQAGCTTTPTTSTTSTVEKSILASKEEAEAKTATPSIDKKKPSVALSPISPGIGLAEITDTNQIPDFKDDYDKISLLYAIDNSRVYFKKANSYPGSFKTIGFTPEKQIETLNLLREGYVSSKSPQELSEFITKNFRVFQVVDKQKKGDVQFSGYGFDFKSNEVVRTFKQYLVHYGTTGLPVNPMRSIRTKQGALPLGALAFAVIEKGGQVEKTFFVFGHETRSDIKSAANVDVFIGIGDNAVENANNYNHNGKLYYLLKR